MADTAFRERPERERWDEGLYRRAQEMYNETPRPSFAKMAERLADEFHQKAPTDRALREWPGKGWLTEEPEDAPWRFGDGFFDDDDDALVLAFIQRGVADFAGYAVMPDFSAYLDPAKGETYLLNVLLPTRRGARWIVRIRKAAPDLEDENFIGGLVDYLMAGGRRAVEAEMLLAFAPWRDAAALMGAITFGIFEEDRIASLAWRWFPDAPGVDELVRLGRRLEGEDDGER